jgi:hypothetical protein
MIRKNLENVQMMARVVDFYPAHARYFSSNTIAVDAFSALGAALRRISEQTTLQIASANELRTTSANVAAARKALETHVRRIVDTAAGISVDKAGIDRAFRFPTVPTDQALVETAKAFVPEAESIKADFVTHCLPENFIDELKTAVDAFEEARLSKAASQNKRANATTALTGAMEEALKLLPRLDAVVANTLAGNPAALAEWDLTRAVPKRRRSREAAPPVVPTPPQEQPVAQT